MIGYVYKDSTTNRVAVIKKYFTSRSRLDKADEVCYSERLVDQETWND